MDDELKNLPPKARKLLEDCIAQQKAEEAAQAGTAPQEDCPACRGEDATGSCQCCTRHKHRTPEESAALIRRLNRIEGQVRGIRGMVERDVYCTDILTQVSATQAALSAFSRELLSAHIRTCVVEDIKKGDTQVIDDLLATLQKLMK